MRMNQTTSLLSRLSQRYLGESSLRFRPSYRCSCTKRFFQTELLKLFDLDDETNQHKLTIKSFEEEQRKQRNAIEPSIVRVSEDNDHFSSTPKDNRHKVLNTKETTSTSITNSSKNRKAALTATCHQYTPAEMKEIYSSYIALGDPQKAFLVFKEFHGHQSSFDSVNQLANLIQLFSVKEGMEVATTFFKGIRQQFPKYYGQQLCNAFLRELLMAGKIQESQILYKELKADGVFLTLDNYNALIEQVDSDMDPEMGLGYFSEMKIQTKKELQTGEKDLCRPDITTYQNLIRNFVLKGNLERVLDLVTDMKRNDIQPNSSIYNFVIIECSKQGCFELALCFIEEMKENISQPNALFYTSLIFFYCRQAKFTKARFHFQEMKNQGLPPDLSIYNSFIEGHAENRDMIASVKYFEEMKFVGVDPDINSFNSLISGFLDEKRYAEAFHFFSQMKSMGVIPQTATYNSLIQAYISNNEFGKAGKLLQKMRESGTIPNVATHTILIPYYQARFPMKTIKDSFEKLKRDGMLPVIDMYNFFLKNCTKQEENCYLAELKIYNLSPNVGTFNSLIANCGWKKDKQRALELVEELKELRVKLNANNSNNSNNNSNNSNINNNKKVEHTTCKRVVEILEPNLETYRSLFVALGKDEIETVKIFFKDMLQQGIEPDLEMNTLLIDLYCASGQIDGALDILKEMKTSSLKDQEGLLYGTVDTPMTNIPTPNEMVLRQYTDGGKLGLEQQENPALHAKIFINMAYNKIIRGLCEQGDLEKALEYLAELETHDFMATAYGYGEIISYFISRKEFKRAQNLIHDLKRKHLINITYYNMQILLAGNQGNTEAMKEYFIAMKSFLIPNLDTFNYLIVGFGKVGDLESMFTSYQELLATKLQPNTFTFEKLISACGEKNQMKTALKIFRASQAIHGKLLVDVHRLSEVLIKCYMQNNELEAAMKYFDELKDKGHLSHFMYISMIFNSTRMGNIDLALKYFQEMKSFGIVPSSNCYKILINACRKEKKIGLSLQLIAEEKKKHEKFKSIRPTNL